MTDESIIEQMARAMAKSVHDPEWRHYRKPAEAAFAVAKVRIEQARADQ
ncbi:MAG TPA: hypothetical protein VGN60_07620 [Devosia sp.]|jgi:hypothetical protein|nr:hypothetical protein [Devosia sp.]